MDDNITVEVVYGTTKKQKIIRFEAKKGITAIQAVMQSSLKKTFEEIDLDNLMIGIFGKKCQNDTELTNNDRVEIYRPLIADPKAVRKKRAVTKKSSKK